MNKKRNKKIKRIFTLYNIVENVIKGFFIILELCASYFCITKFSLSTEIFEKLFYLYMTLFILFKSITKIVEGGEEI